MQFMEIKWGKKKRMCKNVSTCVNFSFCSPLLKEITEEIMPFCICVNGNERGFSIPTLFSQ